MLPDDLVLLAEVVARIPGKDARDLLRLERRGAFPPIARIDGTLYVRQCDVDAWIRGCWIHVRREVAEAQLKHAGLAPVHNRRAKRGA